MSRVALVTGASRGIGRGIALEMAAAGFDIAAVATKADPSNTESGLFELKPRIEALGQRCAPIACDIADLDQHERAVDEAVAAFGRIDVLINNAGISALERTDVLEMSVHSYDTVMNINLRGAVFLTQRVAKRMIDQSREANEPAPSVIFITSISSYAVSPNRAEYCISKAGLSMAAENFALSLADHDIRVYEVRPGIIRSDMTAGVVEKYDRLIAEGLVPQKRWGEPRDVGQACVTLAQGQLDYATGTVLDIDGGFRIRRL